MRMGPTCEQWLHDRCDGDLEDMPLHAVVGGDGLGCLYVHM